MRKLITRDQEIDLKGKFVIYPADLPNNAQDIKLVGDDYIDLDSLNLNLNIVKYELLHNTGPFIYIGNCNMNKLVLNGYKTFIITNSTINDIYIQSKVGKLVFKNTNIPNLHGNIHLINKIEIEQ